MNIFFSFSNHYISLMRPLMLGITIVLMTTSCDINSVRALKSELKKEGGLYYYQGKPFTGIAFTMWDEKQVKTEQSYKEGELSGESKLFSKDGLIKEEITFKEGFMHGAHKIYFEGSQQLKQEKEFDMGKRVGTWKEYYSDGKVEEEVVYKDELPVSEKSYYKSGQIKKELERINGEVNGKRVLYFENGKIRETGNFVNGKPVDPYFTYDESGNLISDKSDWRHILIPERKHSVKMY